MEVLVHANPKTMSVIHLTVTINVGQEPILAMNQHQCTLVHQDLVLYHNLVHIALFQIVNPPVLCQNPNMLVIKELAQKVQLDHTIVFHLVNLYAVNQKLNILVIQEVVLKMHQENMIAFLIANLYVCSHLQKELLIFINSSIVLTV